MPPFNLDNLKNPGIPMPQRCCMGIFILGTDPKSRRLAEDRKTDRRPERKRTLSPP
jgi:hypothetical protein